MSLIFGNCNFESENNAYLFQHLKENSKPPYFDKIDTWNNSITYLGNYHSLHTPEAVNESPIYTVENLTITVNARLDNRVELCKLLEIPTNLHNEIPNNILILKAYQKWYTDCVNYIHGDWTFAIWNDVKQELFVARDQFGLTGIYYSTFENSFVFSSRLIGILKSLNTIEIDKNEIVKSILDLNENGNRTIYKNIYQLERGYYLLVKKNTIQYNQYFSFSIPTNLIYKKKQDYVEHFLELYENAVKVRMQCTGKIGSMLSGGLDSGSVSALVARELKKKNQQLSVFTAIPQFDSSNLTNANHFGDETHFSKSTAEFSNNMNQFFVNGNDISLLEGIENHINSDCLPPGSPGNSYWVQEILLQANKQGITTLFGGFAGNATISWNESIKNLPLIQKLKHRDIDLYSKLRFIKQAIYTSHVKLDKTSPINTIENKILQSCLNPKILNDSTLIKSLQIENKWENQTNNAKRLLLMSSRNSALSSIWQEYGYQHGINIVDPTRDLNLTNFCLSVPEYLFYNRYMIRESMKGILPENVRLNKQRGKQSSDAQLHIQSNYEDFKNLLLKFIENSYVCEYIDIKKLHTVFNNITDNPSIELQKECSTIFLKGLIYGLFINKQVNYETRN
jgi:asparagine synthase (glutamine-hydrolysing)